MRTPYLMVYSIGHTINTSEWMGAEKGRRIHTLQDNVVIAASQLHKLPRESPISDFLLLRSTRIGNRDDLVELLHNYSNNGHDCHSVKIRPCPTELTSKGLDETMMVEAIPIYREHLFGGYPQHKFWDDCIRQAIDPLCDFAVAIIGGRLYQEHNPAEHISHSAMYAAEDRGMRQHALLGVVLFDTCLPPEEPKDGYPSKFILPYNATPDQVNDVLKSLQESGFFLGYKSKS